MRAARPARTLQANSVTKTHDRSELKILIVDLNNFASFPTLAIGLLTAALRGKGHRVNVLCPLSYNVPATQRERRETVVDHIRRRIHLSDWPPFLDLRDTLRQFETVRVEWAHPAIFRAVAKALAERPDVVLISAYLQHFNSVARIAKLARNNDVPVILGGPMFNLPEVAHEWRNIPGISCVVGAEVDHDLPALVERLCAKDDPLIFPGVVMPDGRRSVAARPLRNLDKTPIPDFTDFPWDRYPVRIVPLMTGRGCQWDKCLFCSDVISTSGRTFRTRSVDNVLLEMQEQASRHDTTNFLFLDLKLNSWPDMIRGVARGIGRYVPGAEWVGTVHVDERADNGLAYSDLMTAAEGGMRRISFGLESGSQRLLDAMRKGSTVARNSTFIRDAHAAGLSIRCTMFKGFPGETAEDMQATADFLEEHAPYLDRVRFNEFTLHTGTPVWQTVTQRAIIAEDEQPILQMTQIDNRRARANYRPAEARTAEYRKAKACALDLVYQINRRKLRDAARQFDGLM